MLYKLIFPMFLACYVLSNIARAQTPQAHENKFENIFMGLQTPKVSLTNKGTSPVQFGVLAQSEGIIERGGSTTFTVNEGFAFSRNGKDYAEKEVRLHNPFGETRKYVLPVLQRKSVALNPGESVELVLNPGSYFVGLQGVDGVLSLLKWEAQGSPKNNSALTNTTSWPFTPLNPADFWRLSNCLKELQTLLSNAVRTPTLEDFSSKASPNPQYYMPRFNHRIWLNPDHQPPQEALQYWTQSIQNLGAGWKFYLWCLDKEKMSPTLAYLQENAPQVCVRELKEITKSHGLWPDDLFNGLMRENYYTVASNIARVFILFTQGGVYCDLGTELFSSIQSLQSGYTNIFSTRANSNAIIEGLMLGQKNNVFLFRLLQIWNNLTRLPKKYMELLEERNYAGVALISSEIFYPILYGLASKGLPFSVVQEGKHHKFNSLGTWFAKGLYGNKPTHKNKVTYQKLLAYKGVSLEQVQRDKYGALLSDYSLAYCGLVELINKHFYGLSPDQVRSKRSYHHRKALSLYLDPQALRRSTVPHTQHRIWLTNPDDPHEVPVNLLEYAKQSLLTLSPDFQTVFWFNTPEALPQTIEWIRNNLPQARIQHTNEVSANMEGKKIFDDLVSLKRFANAGILLRFNILKRFGGIYADMGTLLRGDIQEAIDKFDYIFSQRNYDLNENWLDVNIMASKPNASVWATLFNFINGLERLKETHSLHPEFYSLKRYLPIEEDHAWISGQALSAAIDSTLESEDAIFAMNFNSLFRSGSTNSWVGAGKFGSNSVYTHKLKFV